MWCPLFLVLLVGAASAEHLQAWKTDTEYQYAIRGRTLSALHDVDDQYSGIVMRALLTVQPKSDGTLEAKVTKAQYAQIHTKLRGGWESEIPDNMLEMKQFPMSEKVFEIKMKHGVVRDLIVDKDVPTWEVNVLKSIVSQLQVDTQGENIMPSRYNQEPEGERINAMYKTMEDSVSGMCEVLYDISPLPEYVLQRRPELIPKPELRGDGEIIDIVKTKNFSNCEQRSGYHFGIPGSNQWQPGSNENGNFLSRSSVSRIIITGDLKTFTIQSSVSTNKIILSPDLHENRKGMVNSRVNVTLVKMGSPSSGAWSTPANPESTGNLVYNYNNPFAGANEGRRPGQPMDNRNSEEQRSDRYTRYWRKNIQHELDDESNTSDSSRGADSSESNEEQFSRQPKPTLNEAPAMSMLPFFVGNRGKSIHNAENIDPVMTAKTLASQIGSELQNPNNIPEEQTLEKFSLLARIIRTMNTQQIAEVQRELYQSPNEIDPHDESQSVRRNTWTAFRDAVAQAGTGPALVTIKNWIKEKKIRGMEAARVVGVLSKTARVPTPEYMQAFFELATMPETTNEQFLNSTALVTFSELVRYSQTDRRSARTRYPVDTFSRLLPKQNPSILREYVPYMAEQLKKSIENKELAKSHTFIVALGNIAEPKILAIFEPYLEGKLPATTMQRLMMIFNLAKLAALKPVLVRGVYYRIYQNTGESHKLRCAAVNALILTRPPVSMLQRIAEFTNEDHSKHVNAAVKSSIISASKLESPEMQELAKNARNVRHLLNKESYGFEFTRNYLTDFVDREMNLAYSLHSGRIGSDDSMIPETFYATIQTVLGGFKFPRFTAGAGLTSVKDLYNAWTRVLKNEKKSVENNKMEFSPENIAKLLKIQAESTERVEGAFVERDPFRNFMVSFDESTLQHIPELLKKANAALMNGHNFNMAKIESYDMTMSFPTESGFPFVYTLKTPVMLKVSGSVKADSKPESIEGSVDLRAVYSVQIQSKLGFVTPFEHQHYMAGVNNEWQVYIPIRAKVNYDESEKRVTLKLQPVEQNEKYRILHHSVVPFTSRHDILKLSPVMKDKETHKLMNSEVIKKSIEIGSRTNGIHLKIDTESLSTSPSVMEPSRWDWNPLTRWLFRFVEKPEYHKMEVFMEPSQSGEQSVIMSGSLETLHDVMTKYDEKRSKEVNAKAPLVKSKKQNDLARRRELLQDAAKGIAAADAWAIDFGLEYPGQEPFQTFVTVAFANSKVDEKSRGLAYWRLTSAGQGLEFESCAGLEARSPKSFDLSKDMSDKSQSKSRKFDIDLRFGKNCESGHKVEIKGEQEQSELWREASLRLPIAIECAKSIRKGIKSSPACQKLSWKMTTMDRSRIRIKYDEATRPVQMMIDEYLNLVTELGDDIKSSLKQIARPEMTELSDAAEITMILSPKNDNNAKLRYTSDFMDVVASDVDVDGIVGLVANVNPDLTVAERLNMDLTDKPIHQGMCVLESNLATTFDARTYPIELGKCWHVVMTTYPRTIKDSSAIEHINENMALSILVRDVEGNEKDVKVTLGNKELLLSRTGSKNKVELNGKILDLSEKRSHREMKNKEMIFEVLERPDGTLRLNSPKYDIDALYDGKRLQIKASGRYRNDVRGLCGNYDGESVNDFTNPKDCVLSKPEEFVASYALTSSDCQGPALQWAKKASEAICSKKTPRPGNVVSDREAGRSTDKVSSWGHHSKQNDELRNAASTNNKRCTVLRTKIIEEADKTCFSMKPMPTCAADCKASRTKPKVMPMHCMPKNAATDRMVDNIKRGANPDLSQKEFSKKSAFDIPVGCHAA